MTVCISVKGHFLIYYSTLGRIMSAARNGTEIRLYVDFTQLTRVKWTESSAASVLVAAVGRGGNSAAAWGRRRRSSWSRCPSTWHSRQPRQDGAGPVGTRPMAAPGLSRVWWKPSGTDAPPGPRGWRSAGRTLGQSPTSWEPEPPSCSSLWSLTRLLLQLQPNTQ